MPPATPPSTAQADPDAAEARMLHALIQDAVRDCAPGTRTERRFRGYTVTARRRPEAPRRIDVILAHGGQALAAAVLRLD